jgi:protocatechuate 3,4-dioxygenase alpha subunit
VTESNDSPVATPSQTVGPFFHGGLATETLLGLMAGPQTPGERLRLRIRVFDGAGDPLPDALVELWQADAAGRYVEQPDHVDAHPGHAFRGWGRLPTSAAGECTFETIRPGATPADDGRQQAAHINVCLFFRGIMRHIFTRIYFADDPLLAADPVMALVPALRRQTLVAERMDDMWAFDIRLQGERETVFFDL